MRPVSPSLPAAGTTTPRLDARPARDRARAEAFATKHGIPTVFGSYEEMFASPDVDAVYIASPNGLHKDHAIAALRAGARAVRAAAFAHEQAR